MLLYGGGGAVFVPISPHFFRENNATGKVIADRYCLMLETCLRPELQRLGESVDVYETRWCDRAHCKSQLHFTARYVSKQINLTNM